MKNVTVLSRAEMKNVIGGRSKLYCAIASFNIVIQGVVIKQGVDYDTCRASSRNLAAIDSESDMDSESELSIN